MADEKRIAALQADLPVVHSDERRTIREAVDLDNGTATQLLEVGGGSDQVLELGRHAHEQLNEKFEILRGGGEVLMAGEDSPEFITQRVLHEGYQILVPPGIIHLFRLRGGSVMLCSVTGVDADHRPGQDAISYPDFGKEK